MKMKQKLKILMNNKINNMIKMIFNKLINNYNNKKLY